MEQEAPGRRLDRKPSLPRLEPPVERPLPQRLWQHLLLLAQADSWKVAARSRRSNRTADHHCKFDPTFEKSIRLPQHLHAVINP